MNSERTGDGNVLMKLKKEWRKWPQMDVQKAWSANSQPLGKLSLETITVNAKTSCPQMSPGGYQ